MAKQILSSLTKSEKTKVRNFKATDADFEAIKSKAKKFADGNISHWIRHASMSHTPLKKDLTVKK